MKQFNITTPSTSLKEELINKINNKTKPLGSLGKLEEIATQVGLIQNTTAPKINKPNLIVFAADHGLAKAGVSAYPQEVTFQMVLNFVGGGAAINVFSKHNDIELTVVDAGVNYNFDENLPVKNLKIAHGTQNILENPAMTIEQCNQALSEGANLVNQKFSSGCNTISFGEMGIGNTATASLLMSQYCNLPIEECVGSGTGLDKKGIEKKASILKECINKYGKKNDAFETLATYGGFEIAMMAGAMLQAAENKMIVIVDGFIATSALLAAHAINKDILPYCLFAHQSHEAGHKKMIEFFDGKPILQLGMRLGEGTGAAISLPIIKNAVNFLNEMASFEEASVSNKED